MRLASISVLSAQVLRISSRSAIVNSTFHGDIRRFSMQNSEVIKYPFARRSDAKEDFFGRTIANQYNWFEDESSAETKKFMQDQNELFRSRITRFKELEMLKKDVKESFNFERFSLPSLKDDGYWYWSYNPGLLNQPQIWRSKSIEAYNSKEESELFFDPNTLSKDGSVSLSQSNYSWDGRFSAHQLSMSTSDAKEIRVIKNDNKQFLDDTLKNVKFSDIAWLIDGERFLYSVFPHNEGKDSLFTFTENQEIRLHRLNTLQSEDVLIARNLKEPKNLLNAETTKDGSFVLISQRRSTDNEVKMSIIDVRKSYDDLHENGHRVVISNDFSASYDYITNVGPDFYFMTNRDSPRNKIIKINIDNYKSTSDFTEIIPQYEEVIVAAYHCASNYLIVIKQKDVKHIISIHNLDGQWVQDVEIPIGTVAGISCRPDNNYVFFLLNSFLSPPRTFRFSLPAESSKIVPELYRGVHIEGLNPEDYISEQVFYKSRDGTSIPMFINRRKNLRNQNPPVLLYGYGGFEISLTPMFSIEWVIWMRNFGGIVAVPNIRGGGEYGKEWHNAGRKFNKQNSYDDFQYAARYLVQKRITTTDKIAINGGSNGGLLVSVCLNQSPNLFGAAVAEVPVADLLRFQRYTIGHAWIDDFGNPERNEKEFENAYAISPLENISVKVPYPPTLIMTGENDDRVVPSHSLKFAASLQYSKPDNPHPLLLRVTMKVGHGAGKPVSQQIEEKVEKLAFISLALKCEYHKTVAKIQCGC